MEQFIQFALEHYILTTLWLFVLIMLVIDLFHGSSVKRLSAQEATIKVNQGGIFVDTRTDEEFKQGHIVQSRQVGLAEIREGNLKKLEKYKKAPIIVVCNYGSSARTAASLLLKAGFEQVFVLQGGIQAWKGANLPLQQATHATNKSKK